MENPAQDIKQVVRTLAHGTPDEQHDAIYRYFAPGATFEHPFCRVPSFKDLKVPGVGRIDSRALIMAIYRWYKILSPRIELQIESCVFDEQTNIAYVRIFQVFSIWFIPFHRARVRLVSVLHLGPATSSGAGTPPPPYDAAKEKLQAVKEGAEPSYAAVASGESSAESSGQGQPEKEGSQRRPARYQIKKQEDLYQVNEFLKFVSLRPGAACAGVLQLFSTLFCLLGAILLSPFMKTIWPAKSEEKNDRES